MIFGMDLPLSKDGILYSENDSVKIACNDCEGCNSCCENMLDTIVLDPYDIWQLCHRLKISGGGQVNFQLLISEDGPLELGYCDGVISPHLKMIQTEDENVGACSFLNEQGRCSIHFCRPGLCRLYPLARLYYCNEKTGNWESGYFILDEKLGCPKKDTEYIKVKDWIGIDNTQYEDFLRKWHQIKKTVRKLEDFDDVGKLKDAQLKVLEVFFARPYGNDFFKEFNNRISQFVI